VTVEDERGARALLEAVRAARVINTMSSDEAMKAGIEERYRRRYFRTDNGKANLTPPPEFSDWFKIESVTLDNSPGWDVDGDNVGVVTGWKYPKVDLPGLTSYQISAVQAAIKAGRWRADARATKEPWVGIPIAQTLGLDLNVEMEKQRVKKLIKDWLEVGWLRTVQDLDAHRETHDYIVVGVSAGVEPTTAQEWQPGDA
jgi:hypothetical protein